MQIASSSGSFLTFLQETFLTVSFQSTEALMEAYCALMQQTPFGRS